MGVERDTGPRAQTGIPMVLSLPSRRGGGPRREALHTHTHTHTLTACFARSARAEIPAGGRAQGAQGRDGGVFLFARAWASLVERHVQ